MFIDCLVPGTVLEGWIQTQRSNLLRKKKYENKTKIMLFLVYCIIITDCKALLL